MKEFLSKYLEVIIGAVFFMVFVFQVIRLLKKAKRIDRQGDVTAGIVSRVEELWDPETHSSSYITYVRYRDENGVTRESPMALTPNVEHEEGDEVLIRFMPGEYDMVREIKE